MAILAPSNRFDLAADLLVELPTLTAAARARLGITVKAQAAQIGIQPETLTRLEAGSNPTQSTTISVLRWMGRN